MSTLSIEPQDAMDWELTKGLREYNEQFNSKTTVLCQLQKFVCSLCSRMGWKLHYDVSIQDQEIKHEYKLGDKLSIRFSAFGPLNRSVATSGTPQTLKQFQAFLEQIEDNVKAPVNGAVTDMLRCMTVVNEKEFLIDSYKDEEYSFLELKSPSLRQMFQFTVNHD